MGARKPASGLSPRPLPKAPSVLGARECPTQRTELVPNPAPPHSGYVVLGEPPTLSGLRFLIYEMGMIMLPAEPRVQPTVIAQGLLAPLSPGL